MNPPIYIIGAGAIGKVLAVFLQGAGKQVVLVRGSVSNEPTLNSKIEVNLIDKSSISEEIKLLTLDKLREMNGLVVLTNKSFGNSALAGKLKLIAKNSPLVLLQNGLGVEDPFINEGFKAIYRCVLFATSQPTSENVYRFQPVAESAIGVIKGDKAQLDFIVSELNNPNFPFRTENDIQKIIWKKAISNVVFNSVCPLLEIDNGIFHRNEKALALATRVIEECIVIANEAGVLLSAHEVLENLLKISKASDGQLISTLQDIRSHRPTEIDTFNFAVVAMAKKFGKEHLVAETKLLGELTKLKSELNLQ